MFDPNLNSLFKRKYEIFLQLFIKNLIFLGKNIFELEFKTENYLETDIP